MKKIVTHKFRDKRWGIKRGKPAFEVKPDHDLGTCDHPKTKQKFLMIPNGEQLEDLSATIHEGLHACFWDIEEDAVDDASQDIARLLWRLGWRKQIK